MPAARLLLLPLAALLLGGANSGPAPRRIVSLNLCADQLLIALADRGQIAGLTRLSRDPAMSAAADRAKAYPVVRGTAEELAALRPDLVIAAPGMAAARFAGGARVIELPPAESFAAIRAQLRLVAHAVGHPARGEAAVRALDARLAAVRAPARRLVAAHYQRRGYLTGTGTLVDEIMTRAGLDNVARRLGRPPLSVLPLESLVAAAPDALVTDGEDRIEDQGSEMLLHPAIRAIPRLRIASAATVCGGPATAGAVASLARQAASLRPR